VLAQHDSSFAWLSEPLQQLEQRAFASTSSSNNSNLLSPLNFQSEVFDSRVKMRLVPHLNILKRNFAVKLYMHLNLLLLWLEMHVL
jgi:hypothetical protein